MEIENKRKKAAAVSAVFAYLRQEEDALRMPEVAIPEPVGKPQQIKLWGISGRQDMMNMRAMMQMKAFSRLR